MAGVDVDLPAEVGEVIAGYRLERVIGRGGMSCVYAAVHARLGRPAAVKVLSRSYALDQSYVSRFFQEAKIVNDVRHPNIVDIFDFYESDQPRRIACVMELLTGPSLESVLRKQRFSLPQALNVIFQLSSALRAVHKVEIIHRDLKPDNIIVVAPVTSDLSFVPAIKVLDFGIAKVAEGRAVYKTATGAMVGTPGYMAPEQIMGLPVSAATDVYALGEILFELLAGRRVFTKQDIPSLLKTKLTGERPTITLPDDIPDKHDLEIMILGCLASEPAERPTLDHIDEVLLRYVGIEHMPGPLPPRIPTPMPVRPPSIPPGAEAKVHASAELVRSPLSTEIEEAWRPAIPKRRALVFAAVFLAVIFAALMFTFVRVQTEARPAPVIVEPLVEPRGVSPEFGSGPDRMYGGAHDVRREASPDPKPAVVEAQPQPDAPEPVKQAAKPAPKPPLGRTSPKVQVPKRNPDFEPLKKTDVPTW